jgi:hypothetical protein
MRHAPDKIISLDCEANGLHGQIFAAAASVQTRRSGEIGFHQYRIPILGGVDPWVQEHVLPGLDGPAGIPIAGNVTLNARQLLHWWRELYGPLKVDGYAVVIHVGWPVEHRFLWYAHLDEPFSGPFPLWDVAPMMGLAGYDPTSVDGYLKARGIVPPDGSPHHPLYDARATAEAFWDLTERV